MSTPRDNWLKFYTMFSEGYEVIEAVLRVFGTNVRYTVHKRSSVNDAREIVWIIVKYNGDSDTAIRADSIEYSSLDDAIRIASKYRMQCAN